MTFYEHEPVTVLGESPDRAEACIETKTGVHLHVPLRELSDVRYPEVGVRFPVGEHAGTIMADVTDALKRADAKYSHITEWRTSVFDNTYEENCKNAGTWVVVKWGDEK